jgi:hypothetical protein
MQTGPSTSFNRTRPRRRFCTACAKHLTTEIELDPTAFVTPPNPLTYLAQCSRGRGRRRGRERLSQDLIGRRAKAALFPLNEP